MIQVSTQPVGSAQQFVTRTRSGFLVARNRCILQQACATSLFQKLTPRKEHHESKKEAGAAATPAQGASRTANVVIKSVQLASRSVAMHADTPHPARLLGCAFGLITWCSRYAAQAGGIPGSMLTQAPPLHLPFQS
jgi:hypothetical protein